MLSFFSRNIRKKAISVLFLTLIGLGFSLSQVKSADDDDSIGDFDIITAVNNPTIYLNWFFTYEIINPLIDVEFNVTVYDEDNTSDELVLILYYSDSFFQTSNVSVVLDFQVENSPHNYTYNYTLIGRISNIHVYYYYTVYDGLTLQRKPASTDEYYDVLWLAPPATIVRYKRDVKVIEQFIDMSPLVIMFLIMFILVMIVKARKKKS